MRKPVTLLIHPLLLAAAGRTADALDVSVDEVVTLALSRYLGFGLAEDSDPRSAEVEPPTGENWVGILVGPGEFFDRLAIYQLKLECFRDKDNLRNAEKQLRDFMARETTVHVPSNARGRLQNLRTQLYAMNRVLWDLEGRLRECEQRKRFDTGFIEFARSVYRTNDRRSHIKGEIDLLLSSAAFDPKEYSVIDDPGQVPF